MDGVFRTDLEPRVKQTEALILRIVRRTVPNAYSKRIGPIDFGQQAWSCWIITATDHERDMLIADYALMEQLIEAGKAVLLPDSFTFQSEQTVSRDYEGSWFYAMR